MFEKQSFRNRDIEQVINNPDALRAKRQALDIRRTEIRKDIVTLGGRIDTLVPTDEDLETAFDRLTLPLKKEADELARQIGSLDRRIQRLESKE